MHVAKYTSVQVANMLAHYDRRDYENRNFSNENIDKDKTHLNYNLAPDRGMTDKEYIDKRLSEVKCLNRKDTIKMADWVVTVPKDYEGDKRQFFEQTYKALTNRYGEQNVISAYVHRDEKSEHMHYAFMPIVRTIDKNGQEIEKLSAKEVLTRQELREMHPYMERCLSRNLREPVRLLNDATRQGNRAVEELKRDSNIKALQEIEAQKHIKEIEPKELTPRFRKVDFKDYQKERDAWEKLAREKEIERVEKERENSRLLSQNKNLRDNLQHEYKRNVEHEEQLRDKEYLKEQLKALNEPNRALHSHDRDR